MEQHDTPNVSALNHAHCSLEDLFVSLYSSFKINCLIVWHPQPLNIELEFNSNALLRNINYALILI